MLLAEPATHLSVEPPPLFLDLNWHGLHSLTLCSLNLCTDRYILRMALPQHTVTIQYLEEHNNECFPNCNLLFLGVSFSRCHTLYAAKPEEIGIPNCSR